MTGDKKVWFEKATGRYWAVEGIVRDYGSPGLRVLCIIDEAVRTSIPLGELISERFTPVDPEVRTALDKLLECLR